MGKQAARRTKAGVVLRSGLMRGRATVQVRDGGVRDGDACVETLPVPGQALLLVSPACAGGGWVVACSPLISCSRFESLWGAWSPSFGLLPSRGQRSISLDGSQREMERVMMKATRRPGVRVVAGGDSGGRDRAAHTASLWRSGIDLQECDKLVSCVDGENERSSASTDLLTKNLGGDALRRDRRYVMNLTMDD